MSAGEVVKLTRLGGFRMDAPESGMMALLKRLRGAKKPGGNAGAQQLAMLKRLPQILRFIPGKAQDVRAYFLALQYWLSGSEANVVNLVRLLVDRYADGPRRGAARHAEGGPAGALSRARRLSPAHAGRMAEQATKLPRSRRRARHRRAAGDALLSAGRQHRPLRRRHRGARGARASTSSRPSPAGSTRAPRSRPSSSATARRSSTRWSR